MSGARIGDTLRELVVHPGAISRALLDGQGQRYLPLGRLVLVLAALFFAITALQFRLGPGGPSPEVAAACGDAANTSDLGLLLSAADAPSVAESSPGAVRALRLAGDVLCHPQRYTRAFAIAVPLAFLLLMPLSAGLMRMAFREQMPTFSANWVCGLEAHAALFLLLAALAVVSLSGSFLLGLLASLGGLVYASWNLVAGVQRAYGVSARTAAWRTTVVGVVYALALTVVALLFVWPLLAWG